MGFIARRLISQNLQDVQVLVDDLQNQYFDVVELASTITQGRSAFKIFGSRFLKRGVPLKMEILDSSGNTVYISPVDSIGEEVAPFLPYRFVTVEVYPPPINREGTAILTILGEIEPDAVDFQIPTQFKNSYNVKFQQRINLDLSTVINNQSIRFYKDPVVEAVEVVKEKRINTEVTSSERIFTSTDITNPITATPRADIVDIPIVQVTGSQEKEDDVIPQVSKPNKEIINLSENIKYKAGLHAGLPPVVKRRGKRPRFASKEQSAMRIKIPNGNLTAKMQGGTVTIPAHTKKYTAKDEDGNHYETEITVPKFETKIANIVNDEIFEIDKVPVFEIPTITGSAGNIVFEPPPAFVKDGKNPVQVDDFINATISMSFEDVATTTFSSSFEKNSYVDLTIKNMRTFSGDVYRVKVHGKMQSDTSAFSQMADTVIESPELLRDTNSPSGMLRTGYFLSSGHLNAYWSASSFDSLTKAANVTASHNSSQYIDSLYLSGSNRGLNETIVAETKQDFPFTIRKGVVYTLSMLVKGQTTEKVSNAEGSTVSEGKLYFHISGSNLNTSKRLTTNTYVGAELTEPDSDKTVYLELDEDISGIQDFDRIEHTFTPRFNLDRLINTDTVLQLRADSGEWYVSDISLRPAMDTGFSPDEYSIQLPVPTPHSRPDKLDIFVEYFDINHNAVDTLTEKLDIPILGAPLIIAGTDNLLTGSLFIGNIQDKGIEAAGVNSAYMRSIGFIGFTSASIGNPTASLSAGDNTGHGGFMIWSGSVLPDAPDNYTGAGLEIHDGISGADESYFKFRTNPSLFDVKSKVFFFGQDAATNKNYISGSNGKLEISSSAFALSADGNVTASNFLMQSGVITDGVTVLGSVAANSLILPAEIAGATATPLNASASIDQRGNARFRSGSIGGFSIGPIGINSLEGSLVLSGSGQITGSSVLFTGGKIGGFTLSSTTISATNFELNPAGKSISLGSGDDIFIVDGDVGMQLGDSTFADAPFSVTVDGAVSASKGNIGGWKLAAGTISSNNLIINASGLLETSDYVSGFKGWRISAEGNGFLEVEEARIRGTLKTTVFEKETVNAVGGQLYIANSTTITGSSDVAADDSIIQVANVSGFTAREVITAKKVSATGFSTEYMQVVSVSRKDSSSDTNFSGSLTVTRGYGQKSVSGSGALDAASSGSIGEQGVAGQTYGTGQVIVSTGKVGTGFIKLNANPNDQTTPYMDMVERTGSGVFDAELKVRLGDLSGLSSALVGGSPGFGLFTDRAFLTNDVTVGSPGTEHITIDSTSVRFIDDSTTMAELRGTTWTIGGAHGATDDVIVLSPGGGVSIQDSSNDKVVVDSDGVKITENNQLRAIFGAISVIGSSGAAVTTSSTDDCIRIAGGTVSIFQDDNNKAVVNSSGLTITQGGADVATFGGSPVITGGTITLRNSTNNNDKLVLSENSMVIFDNNNEVASFGANTIIEGGTITLRNTGNTNDNVVIAADSFTVNDNGNAVASFGANTILEGGSITLRSTANNDDNVVITADSFTVNDNGNAVASFGANTILEGGSITLRSTANTNDNVVITADSFTVNDNGNAVASFGANTVIEGGSITLRSTANTDDNVVITADSFTVNDNGNAVASFGANTVIEGGTVRIQNVTNTGDALLLAQDSMKVLDNGTEVASFGGTTTIGDTSGNHVSITSNTLKLKNAGAEIISLAEGAVTVSGSILEKTRLFGSGIDATIILTDDNGGSSTFNESSYGVDGADGVRVLLNGPENNDGKRESTQHWHMKNDIYCQNFTLNSPCTLFTNGFRLFVKDTLTIASGATISNDGFDGSGVQGGEGGGPVGGGGNLSAGSDGTTGGEGGGASPGGGQDGGDAGGGGGSGGFVFISARTIANSGTIQSKGGDGGGGSEGGS